MRTDTRYSKTVSTMMWFMALLLVVITAGCDRDHGAAAQVGTVPIVGTVPTVLYTIPANGATDVPLNRKISAAFSEPMSAATVTALSTFTLTGPGATPVPAATITYDAATRIALFTLASDLTASTTYIGTITVGAKNAAGNAMANNYVWSFTTGITIDAAAPLLLSTSPVNSATNVPLNQIITATFDEPMDPLTITPTSYTVTGPTGTVLGDVSYLGATASFKPAALLASNATYTVVIAASDMAGQPWVFGNVPNPWSFSTGATAPVPGAVNLGLATPFGIAATAGVTNTPTTPLTTINGDVALDPNITCNAVTIDSAGGFGLCGSNASTPIIVGKVVSPLYPDAGITSAAIKADLKKAFLSITPTAGPPAAGSLDGATNLPAGTTLGDVFGSALVQGDNLFAPGVYQSLTSILITGDLTLDAGGDPNASFIFQSSSTIGTAAGAAGGVAGTFTRILLINGAKASNVWWQAGTSATLGLYSEFQGNILASESITMETGATSCGRLLAGAFAAGAFVFDSNVVSVPGQTFAPPAGYSTTCE